MQTIKEILATAQENYTPMGIDKELVLIDDIKKLSVNDIKYNLLDFYSILQLLYDSHGDDYVSVDGTNKDKIKQFILWLKEISKEPSIDKDLVEDLIDIFSINVFY